MNSIDIKNITKKYDGFCLDNVSFSIPRGSVCGFIGQNGAGKTTTIKSILNAIEPDSGSISVLGYDNRKQERQFKERIAVVFDELPFHDDLNAKKINTIMKGIFKNWDKETFFNYLGEFGIPVKKKIGDFSKGMKMKLQIAVALSHNAELLIMDEATSGLDPIVRNEVLDIFNKYMQNKRNSILMSSHITSDLEKIADKIVFIHKGKILLDGKKDEILARHGIVKCTKEDLSSLKKEEYISARHNDTGLEILVSDKTKVKNNHPDFAIENTSLEEIMLFYVNSEKKEW